MKTLKQWNKKGRRIKKGSKAKGFTTEGEALFKKKQIYKIKDSNYIYDSCRDISNYDQNIDESDEFMWTDPLNY